jgi:PAS domain S-box-containing protein
MKFRLNAKILIFILSTSSFVFALAVGIIGYNLRKKALDNSMNKARTLSTEYANLAKSNLDNFMVSARTISQTFSQFESLEQEKRRPTFDVILKSFLTNNPEYIASWSIWEPNTIDSLDNFYKNKPGSTFMGNYSPTYYKDGDSIKIQLSTSQVLFQGDYYTIPKNSRKETVLNPYYYSYTELEKDEILQTNMIVPILSNDNFMGVVGVDVPLTLFQELNQKIKPFDDGYSILIANDGKIVAHPDTSYINKNFIDLYPKSVKKHDIKNFILKGSPIAFFMKPLNNKNLHFYSFSPVFIGHSITPWSFVMVVPKEKLMQKAHETIQMAIISGIAGIAILFIIIWIIASSISRPIVRTTNVLKEISVGNINESNILKIRTSDEIGEMAQSVNKLMDGLNSTAMFAEQIGNGELSAKFDLLSDKDILGNSLLDMRQSLIYAKEEEKKRKLEDDKQNWITQGIAKFGELQREHNDDMNEFSFNIIKNLVSYLNAVQGAFFLLNNDDSTNIHYELSSLIAFDKRKYIEKQILPGEELVGRCAEERKTIYIKEVPEDYVFITPGLKDEAKPRSLIVVPLNLNDIIYGVVELISYTPFENYHIEFVEKVGESLASTIAMIKVNLKTTDLLDQSRRQADELAQQEEEMRQNMEEMLATQEETEKKEHEKKGVINALKSSTLTAELDLEGNIISISDTFAAVFGISRKQMMDKNYEVFLPKDEETKLQMEECWMSINNNNPFEKEQKITSYQKTSWIYENFIPISQDGYVYKALLIAQNITEEKELQENIEKIKSEIEELNN